MRPAVPMFSSRDGVRSYLNKDCDRHGEAVVIEGGLDLLKPVQHCLLQMAANPLSHPPEFPSCFEFMGRVEIPTFSPTETVHQAQSSVKIATVVESISRDVSAPSAADIDVVMTSKRERGGLSRDRFGQDDDSKSITRDVKARKGEVFHQGPSRRRVVYDEKEGASRAGYKCYVRCLEYSSAQDLARRLQAHKAVFPADAHWATALIETCDRFSDSDVKRKVYMMYAGATATSVMERAQADMKAQDFKLLNRLLDCIQAMEDHLKDLLRQEETDPTDLPGYGLPTTMSVHEWCLSSENIDAVDFRTRQDLQDVERALIAATMPSANFARGGFTASMSPHPVAPNAPLPLVHVRRDPLPDSTVVKARIALRDSRRLINALSVEDRGYLKITDAAFDEMAAYACRGALFHGSLLSAIVAKDITHEAFRATEAGYGFYGERTGRGPRTIVTTQLQSLGVVVDPNHPADPSRTSPPVDSAALFGPFIDLWSLCLRHRCLWIVIFILLRHLLIVRPVIIRVYSAKVTLLFVEGACTKIWKSGMSDDEERLKRRFIDCEAVELDQLQSLASKTYWSRNWSSTDTALMRRRESRRAIRALTTVESGRGSLRT
ncbi:hypothetical protein IAR55_006573 [Kwoniella newhampshirensis]|uniref:Uncharacterized protein n=1 Tax=Kwoniella newhampshirensis TaxID=1651941 RepID=A0AAW0YJ10_9TREE